MIYIDDRIGSAELLPVFQSHHIRPTCQLKRLSAADFCFSGNGPSGYCMIGVERKRLRDMLNSIRTGRFSGEQLPKLLDQYEYCYLIVEGYWKTDQATGTLLERYGKTWYPVYLSNDNKSPFAALELQYFLNTIRIHTGVCVLYSHNEHDTVDQTTGLWKYYAKPWQRHHEHLALHMESKKTLKKAGTVRRVASVLDGVGWEKSAVIEEYYKTVEAMLKATETDFEKLPGFGKTLARSVWGQLHGRYDYTKAKRIEV